MKILWLCNIPLPQIAEEISIPINNGGGWLSGLANSLKELGDIELIIAFPLINKQNMIDGSIGQIKYYGFPKQINAPYKYEKKVEIYFKEIISKVTPDLVHIFGTVYPHTLAMTKVFNKPQYTIINIQGLCSICSMHYLANLPDRVINGYTFRDLLKLDNIRRQKNKFAKRGVFEIEAIQNVKHVVGRTTWDRACCTQINYSVNYHFCNETLRESFYSNIWNLDKCKKYSIFISQGSYPIKGLHFVIEALREVIKVYPDAHLYVAGESIILGNSLKEKIRISSYGKYIKQLIDRYKLNKYITFTGDLDEKAMCQRFLSSHVFVSASTIENSPNSVGEAMILGVPTITSDVGGVKDMLAHGQDGFTYQYDAPYMLAYYISQIFEDDNLALNLSKNARKSAKRTHNRDINLKTMLDIYNQVLRANCDK